MRIFLSFQTLFGNVDLRNSVLRILMRSRMPFMASRTAGLRLICVLNEDVGLRLVEERDQKRLENIWILWKVKIQSYKTPVDTYH